MKTSGEVQEVFVGHDVPAAAIKLAKKAKKRLWLASYTCPGGALANVLATKHSTGKKVRLVVSAVPVEALPDYSFPAKRVSVDGGTMHAKFLICDDTVLLGSSNWNDTGSRNVGIRITGTAVRHFAAEYNRLWKLKEGDPLLRGDQALALIAKLVKKKGHSDFATLVARRCRARGYMTPKEQAAITRALK